jgi:membrane protein
LRYPTLVIPEHSALNDSMNAVLQHLLKEDPQKHDSRSRKTLSVSAPVRQSVHSLKLLKMAFRRAFEHDAFAVAKAAAYSSILTLFPGLLILGAILATSPRFEIYVGEISYALGRILPAGSAAAVGYLRNTNDHPVDFLIATSLLTIWTGSSAIVSWMEGFRKAYHLPPMWGIVKERLIACSLVISAGIPLMFSTVLIAFGSQIEKRVLLHTGHRLGPFILLMWTGMRWLIAGLTSVAVIALIYHNAIPRTRRWHTVLPGAVVASVLWFATTWLFGWYLGRSSEYSVILRFPGCRDCSARLDVCRLTNCNGGRRIQCDSLSTRRSTTPRPRVKDDSVNPRSSQIGAS